VSETQPAALQPAGRLMVELEPEVGAATLLGADAAMLDAAAEADGLGTAMRRALVGEASGADETAAEEGAGTEDETATAADDAGTGDETAAEEPEEDAEFGRAAEIEPLCLYRESAHEPPQVLAESPEHAMLQVEAASVEPPPLAKELPQ